MNSNYMNTIVAIGNVGVGVGVAATQVGLFVGAAATNMVLDCIIATKNAGRETLNKGISIEKAIEQRIYNAIGLTQELAKSPSEKLTEHANTFLDISNNMADTIFGLPPAIENPESNFRDRISFLAGRIAAGVSNQANEFVIDPLYQQMNSVLEQLGKCFDMVGFTKQRQEWTYNKVNVLSASMMELRNKIETEAKRAKTSPGEVLLSIIRHYSSKLNEQLGKLRVVGFIKQRQEWTYDKVNALSASMMELRNKIETEAKRAKTSPGEVLLSIIHHYSSKLNEQLGKLHEHGAELISPAMQKQV